MNERTLNAFSIAEKSPNTCTMMDAFISAYLILEIQEQLEPLIEESLTDTLEFLTLFKKESDTHDKQI